MPTVRLADGDLNYSLEGPAGAPVLLLSNSLGTGLGVVQVPLPQGEFLVGLQDPVGARRFGVVRFDGLDDQEGWGEQQ